MLYFVTNRTDDVVLHGLRTFYVGEVPGCLSARVVRSLCCLGPWSAVKDGLHLSLMHEELKGTRTVHPE